MNRVLICLLLVMLAGFSPAALAVLQLAQVDPPSGPPPKSTVLHCGCTTAGDGLEYVAINISSKSKGHDAHAIGGIETCFDGVDTYTDFVRIGSDCQLDGPPLGDPIEACGEQLEFDNCGEEVVD